MQSMSAQLEMSSHHFEASYKLFQLAVEHRFIQGRKTLHVAAACLYIQARMDRTSRSSFFVLIYLIIDRLRRVLKRDNTSDSIHVYLPSVVRPNAELELSTVTTIQTCDITDMPISSNCGTGFSEEDTARGDTVCRDCGNMLAQNTIVAEVMLLL